jgi:peptidoglycan/LPS O-acetylase OafA/YrhL
LWAELASNAVWFATIRHARRWMPALGLGTFAAMIWFAWRYQTLDYGAWQGVIARFSSLVRATAWFSVGYAIAMAKPRVPASPLFFLALLLSVMAASAAGIRPRWVVSVATAGVGSFLLAALRDAPPPGRGLSQVARWLGMASFPMYLIHAPAGRLLPLVSFLPAPLALVLVMGSATVVATLLNEAAMRWLHRRPVPAPAAAPT